MLQKCADKYATQLGDIVYPGKQPNELSALVKDKLQLHQQQSEYPCQNPLVINASPGSSGTRSLFLAALALNVSASHYFRRGFNCSYGMIPLVSHDKVTFWGDTPFSHLWWYFLQVCPSSRFIVTIIDPHKWHSARVSHYNPSSSSEMEWDYILPIPFLPPISRYPFPRGITPPLPEEIWLSSRERNTSNASPDIENSEEKSSPLSESFENDIANMLSLKTNSVAVATEAYKAFMELVQCAVPADRLLVIDLTSTAMTPFKFWTELANHFGISSTLTSSALDSLVSAGMPYWGRKVCRLGTSHDCPFKTLGYRRQNFLGMGWPGPCK